MELPFKLVPTKRRLVQDQQFLKDGYFLTENNRKIRIHNYGTFYQKMADGTTNMQGTYRSFDSNQDSSKLEQGLIKLRPIHKREKEASDEQPSQFVSFENLDFHVVNHYYFW